MKIPAFDYRPVYRRLRPRLLSAVERVLASGRLILGPEVAAFEEELASFVGAGGAVGVNSGTDALILALRALGVGPGDDVITVSNAGVPPVAAIRAVGATPRFCDVDPVTLEMDPEGLESALSPRSRCVLPVHLYGHPAPLEPILEFARLHGLRLVEDCAQAHGARYDGVHVGTSGEVGCFSFYPTKNLAAFGDGGACVSRDPELLEQIRRQRMYGFDTARRAVVEGLNSRLDELQAALLRVAFEEFEGHLAERRRIAGRYREGLVASRVRLPAEDPRVDHAFHLFVIRTDQRARLVAHLEQHGIGHGIHYADPVHRMPAYRSLGYPEGALPVTERASAEVLSLPLYPGLSDREIDAVVDAVLSF